MSPVEESARAALAEDRSLMAAEVTAFRTAVATTNDPIEHATLRALGQELERASERRAQRMGARQESEVRAASENVKVQREARWRALPPLVQALYLLGDSDYVSGPLAKAILQVARIMSDPEQLARRRAPDVFA
jgi:hypothetical protein